MKSVDAEQIRSLAERFGTPCYVYTAEVIRARIRSLAAFDVVRYAQKACSNLHILRLVREAGALVDAVSLGEIERALRAGFRPGREPAELVYTSDVIDEATLDRVVALGIPMNAGSEDMLDQLGRRRRGHPVWLRVNPGFGHGHSRKTNTGGCNLASVGSGAPAFARARPNLRAPTEKRPHCRAMAAQDTRCVDAPTPCGETAEWQ